MTPDAADFEPAAARPPPGGHLALRVAQLIFNTPLLCAPAAAEIVASALAGRWGVEAIADIDMSGFVGAPVRRTGADGQARAMYRLERGVALIDVRGELVNRGAWIGASSGLTSYEGLDAQLAAAASDPEVRGVVLDIDSPGGAAAGAMETAARVRKLAAVKPVAAWVNGQAASAAYAIASGATTIIAAPSASLGSIGVVWLHLDRSGQLARSGIKPTLIHAGAHKVDGHPFSALPDDARARIVAQIDAVYQLFVSTVAAHRGLDAAAVTATEAGMFMGAAAVAAGLADAVGTLDDALAFFDSRPAASSPLQRFAASPAAAGGIRPQGVLMTETTDTIARAAHDTALATARADGAREGAAAALARAADILDMPEAKGREAMARNLAFKTSIDAAMAKDLLVSAPQAAAAAGPGLAALVPRPNVQPDGPGPAEPRNDYERGAAAFAAAAGRKAA